MPQSRAEANKRLWGLLSKSKTKTLIAESSGAVASSSNSVSQSTESTSNSVALSKAFKKLNDIDFSYDIADQLENDNEWIDYIGRIEKYANHVLRDGISRFELEMSQWKQVNLAAEWAVRVHKIKGSSEDTIFCGPKSATGNSRPFCLHTTRIDERDNLIIAFRATRWPMYSAMEWAVNTNTDPTDCEELGVDMKCHRGLLALAKNMEPLVAAEITKLFEDRPPGEVDLLFTGHSSGAAIAQLLFASMHSNTSQLSRLKAMDKITCIDCVTFGGPPVSRPAILRPTTKAKLFISFINEGDPAPLAQESYMRSLVEAWTRPVTTEEWAIPPPFYIPSGDQVVLRGETDENDELKRILPLQVDPKELEAVVFGDIAMHSMSHYVKRIQMILQQPQSPQNPFEDQ